MFQNGFTQFAADLSVLGIGVLFCILLFLTGQSKQLLFSQLLAQSVWDTIVVEMTVLVSHHRGNAACVRLWSTEPARFMALGAEVLVLKTRTFELTFFAQSLLGFFRMLSYRVGIKTDCFRTVTDRSALNTFLLLLLANFWRTQLKLYFFRFRLDLRVHLFQIGKLNLRPERFVL